MAKRKINTLFLDIGGVLLTDGWGRESRQLASEKFKLDYSEMDARHNLTFDTYELGKLTLDDYLNRTVFYEKRAFTKKQFRDFMFSQSKPFPEMMNSIIQLKKKYGLKIAVVSNEGRELNTFRIQKFGLANFIDFFISSCFVHFRKPDADIYRVALDIAHVKPDEVIYIEDRPMFVSIAKSVGITGIHHLDNKTTCAKMKSFGLAL